MPNYIDWLTQNDIQKQLGRDIIGKLCTQLSAVCDHRFPKMIMSGDSLYFLRLYILYFSFSYTDILKISKSNYYSFTRLYGRGECKNAWYYSKASGKTEFFLLKIGFVLWCR